MIKYSSIYLPQLMYTKLNSLVLWVDFNDCLWTRIQNIHINIILKKTYLTYTHVNASVILTNIKVEILIIYFHVTFFRQISLKSGNIGGI